MKRLFVCITMVMMVVMSASADTPSGKVGASGAEAVAPAKETVTTTVFVEPDAIVEQGKVGWLNQHNFIAYSRGRKGEQVDVVRKGNFNREVEVKCGRMHVRRCGNPIWMIEVEVEQEIVCDRGPQGPQGPPGSSGPPGPPGEPASTPTIIINNFNTSTMASMQLGGCQPAIITTNQLVGMSWYPGIRISNANTNINTNSLLQWQLQQQQQAQQQQQEVGIQMDP